MTELLISLGVLLVMGVIVLALLRVAPRHDREVNNAFEELATRHGLRHQREDDGQARAFAGHFEGVVAPDFESEGLTAPADVVSGVLDGQRILVFRYRPRPSASGEPAAERVVAGLEVKRPVADRCAVQFCRAESDAEITFLADPILERFELGGLHVVVRARDRAGAGRLLEQPILEELADQAGKLASRSELQVRGHRLAACPAEAGTPISEASELDRLLGLAARTARIAV